MDVATELLDVALMLHGLASEDAYTNLYEYYLSSFELSAPDKGTNGRVDQGLWRFQWYWAEDGNTGTWIFGKASGVCTWDQT